MLEELAKCIHKIYPCTPISDDAALAIAQEVIAAVEVKKQEGIPAGAGRRADYAYRMACIAQGLKREYLDAEQAFDKANKAAETYALGSTNRQHVEIALSLAKQYRSDPQYIKRLEAHLAKLSPGTE